MKLGWKDPAKPIDSRKPVAIKVAFADKKRLTAVDQSMTANNMLSSIVHPAEITSTRFLFDSVTEAGARRKAF